MPPKKGKAIFKVTKASPKPKVKAEPVTVESVSGDSSDESSLVLISPPKRSVFVPPHKGPVSVRMQSWKAQAESPKRGIPAKTSPGFPSKPSPPYNSRFKPAFGAPPRKLWDESFFGTTTPAAKSSGSNFSSSNPSQFTPDTRDLIRKQFVPSVDRIRIHDHLEDVRIALNHVVEDALAKLQARLEHLDEALGDLEDEIEGDLEPCGGPDRAYL